MKNISMKKIATLFIVISVLCSNLKSQPSQFYPAINPKDTALLKIRRVCMLNVLSADHPLRVDGVKDTIWDLITSKAFDRFILGNTVVNAGIYSFKEDSLKRFPTDADDFSGSFRITRDDDYIYVGLDILDDEINDGTIYKNMNEMVQIVEAPYKDSAQQMMSLKPLPGTAPDFNKRFAYWATLGAAQISFKIVADGKCNITLRKNADSSLIDYNQRALACQCAWKTKADGSGYFLEAAISLKITLADSTGTSFGNPNPGYYQKSIAFDILVQDLDYGKKTVKASWNAMDDNVWDAMLYTGLLEIFPPTFCNGFFKCGDLEQQKENEISFSPNPATDLINLSKTAQSVEIISMNGILVKSAQNVQQISVADLASGLYVVKLDGKVVGKMIKN